LKSYIARACHVVLDAVLPARCMACGEAVDGEGALCSQCWLGIRFLAEPACACCGFPFEYTVPERTMCIACTRRRPAFDRARAVFAYDDASRGLVLGFKYADRIHHGPAFGRWLARTGAALLVDADLIVPVPLHRWRLFHRRYNQAGLLAQALGREADKPVNVDLLVRQRRTRTQGRMPRSARIRNIQGAFKLRPGRRAAAAGARFC
jgi:predicted amidophosphoribosyltransferase